MNIQNLIAQMGSAKNPLAMMNSMLTGNQKQMINLFQNKPSQEQAEEIARICNEKGISIEQLQNIINLFKK